MSASMIEVDHPPAVEPGGPEKVRTGNAKKCKTYRDKKMKGASEDPVEQEAFRKALLEKQAADRRERRAAANRKEGSKKQKALEAANRQLAQRNRELEAQLVFQPTVSVDPAEQQLDQPTILYQELDDSQRANQRGWLIDFVKLPAVEVERFTDQELQLMYASYWRGFQKAMAEEGKRYIICRV